MDEIKDMFYFLLAFLKFMLILALFIAPVVLVYVVWRH
jgi:hypothetical protein